jgi:hypothetical protein
LYYVVNEVTDFTLLAFFIKFLYGSSIVVSWWCKLVHWYLVPIVSVPLPFKKQLWTFFFLVNLVFRVLFAALIPQIRSMILDSQLLQLILRCYCLTRTYTWDSYAWCMPCECHVTNLQSYDYKKCLMFWMMKLHMPTLQIKGVMHTFLSFSWLQITLIFPSKVSEPIFVCLGSC